MNLSHDVNHLWKSCLVLEIYVTDEYVIEKVDGTLENVNLKTWGRRHLLKEKRVFIAYFTGLIQITCRVSMTPQCTRRSCCYVTRGSDASTPGIRDWIALFSLTKGKRCRLCLHARHTAYFPLYRFTGKQSGRFGSETEIFKNNHFFAPNEQF